LVIGNVGVSENGFNRTFSDASPAIDAFIGIDDKICGEFPKCLYRTDCDTILVFVIDTC